MNGTRSLPDSIQLVLPEQWEDTPLDVDVQRRFIERLRAGGESGQRLASKDLRQVELVLAQVRDLAARERVMLASSYISQERVDDADEQGSLVVAGLVCSSANRVALGTDVPLVADVLIKAFSGRTRQGPIEFDEIEPPTKIELAGTIAVKLVRLMRATGSNAAELKQFTQSYLVPVASGDGLIVLQFSTINLEYARQFSELFEKIARTLRILYPDDPTFLDDEATQTA